MKKLQYIICVLMLALCFVGCKKEAGPGGKNTISGTVVYKNGVSGTNDAAGMATVRIAYGTNEATESFNQTILTDEAGKFKIEGLNKGKYFIKASYQDGNGFNYSNPGYGITIENKKKNIEVNITLE